MAYLVIAHVRKHTSFLSKSIIDRSLARNFWVLPQKRTFAIFQCALFYEVFLNTLKTVSSHFVAYLFSSPQQKIFQVAPTKKSDRTKICGLLIYKVRNIHSIYIFQNFNRNRDYQDLLCPSFSGPILVVINKLVIFRLENKIINYFIKT